MHGEFHSKLPRRSKGGGNLPFLYRPGSTGTPDESTMSIIRRLIYRTSHCFCCPPQFIKVSDFIRKIVTDPFFDVLEHVLNYFFIFPMSHTISHSL